MSAFEITKANGAREEFDPHKLISSLMRSGATEEAAQSVTDRIVRTLVPNATTHDIYRKAFRELKKEGKKVALSYSLRRAVTDLGPSGFPFEDFFAEILKTQGFTTMLDQTIEGHCVPHEMDVIAYNDQKLIMVESKFHNDQGYKTDLKVALYVKARFDDVKDMTYMYGKPRKLDEGWLVTNTKFTSQAITYGTHHNIRLIGWNYPEKGNLQDLIEQSGLHPLTALTSLSQVQKKELMKKGFVLCREVVNDPNTLDSLMLTTEKKERVIEETRLVCTPF